MKHLSRLFAYLLCMAVLDAAQVRGAGEFILAERGKAPPCAIVLESTADECILYAAEELQRFVLETTGVELPVASGSEAPSGPPPVVSRRGRPPLAQYQIAPAPTWA